jgi:helix-turn-helix protein
MQQILLDSIIIVVYSREMKSYLNASEIAKLLKANRATITRWAKKGVFRGAIQVKGTHQWRIPLSAYEEVVKQKPHSIGFSGGRPLPFAIPLKLCRYYSILGHQLH